MQLNGLIYTFPKNIKLLIAVFVLILSLGYFSGMRFVGETTAANQNGIEERYFGNENDDDAAVMQFKKS